MSDEGNKGKAIAIGMQLGISVMGAACFPPAMPNQPTIQAYHPPSFFCIMNECSHPEEPPAREYPTSPLYNAGTSAVVSTASVYTGTASHGTDTFIKA